MANRGKRKEVCFNEKEWELIEKKAAEVKLNTTNYIRRMALNGLIILQKELMRQVRYIQVKWKLYKKIWRRYGKVLGKA